MVKDSVLNYIVYHSFDPSICIYSQTPTSSLSILNSSLYFKQFFKLTLTQIEDVFTYLTPYQILTSE